MKVVRIISKSRKGSRMEVIAKDDNGLRTLHLQQEHNRWMYCIGCNDKGNKVFLPITV